ncbi:hypothetical protein AX27061_4965 [Achromobacter xylosoxidans NBRC 15126 = ATCC 27061]|nr:hypothetical protein AX27061_4965 [Achromobacter xylosoxidans NBRC 15126 = ATCC 27061]CCH07353.1 hypothetical protein NH44784_033991 [Achromobacter xylosoxidans NH44784-1996]
MHVGRRDGCRSRGQWRGEKRNFTPCCKFPSCGRNAGLR